MSLSGSITAVVDLAEVKALDLGSASFPIRKSATWSVLTGTGSGLADMVWTDQVSIAGSATLSLDLSGTLAGMYGNLVFVKLKAILVAAAAANVNNVNVVRPAAGVPFLGAAADLVPVMPGGIFLWVAPAGGVAVTAATADIIELTNSAAGADVVADVVLVGTSA